MSVADAIERRLEVRSYTDEPIAPDTKRAVLDAARLAPSGKNTQHWRFVVLDELADLERLGELSTTGAWITDAAFAVVVLTDPEYTYHRLDAGRAITHMQLAAWERELGSCIYTGYDEEGMRSFLGAPDRYAVTAVVGFGHPDEPLEGRKRRRPLDEVAFEGRFGEPFDVD